MVMRDQLPEGWVWATLGQIADAQSGAGFPKSYQGHPSGDYPFAKVSDISEATKTNGGIIDKANNYLSAVIAKKIGAKVFPVGTTLFAKIGEAVRLNRRAINTCPILADNNVMGLIPDAEKITPRYLFHFMHSVDIYEYSQATTVPSVRKSDIEQIPIPLPPLHEQERIVAKIEALFSQLDAGVAALRRIQAALKRYKASVLKAACEGRLVAQDPADEPAEALLRRLGKAPLVDDDLPVLPEGWCWVLLSTVTDINIRDADIRNLPDDLPVTFVPMAAVDGEHGVIARPVERPLKEVRKGFTSFLEGDVIFAKITPCMENGKAAIVPKLKNGRGFGSTEFHVLRPKENITAQWIFHFVRQESFRADAKASFTGTAGQLRVPASFLINYPIPLSPLPEQQRIVAEIERRLSVAAEVDAVVAALLARSTRLRQSILKQAFEGKLV
jgi:type I restriction enzyme S subunit